jgi:hypothetical protein
VLRQQGLVAVAQVHGPRADHGGIRPGRAAVGADALDMRGDGGHLPLASLCIGDVALPLGKEAGNVAIPGGGPAEDLGVAHPAEALVALRAVGGDLEEIAPLAPVDVALELVDERVVAGKRAGARGVAVQYDAGDGIGQEGVGVAVDLDVAKAVEREARLPGLAARVAAEDIVVGLPGGAQVLSVDRAVGIEHLGEAQADHLAGLAANMEANAADHVLAEVEHPGWGGPDVEFHRRSDGLEFLRRAHERPEGRGQFNPGIGEAGDRRPGAVIVAGFVPAAKLAPGVVRFTVDQVGFDDRAESGLPGAIGHDGLGGAVGEGQHELGEQLRALAVIVALTPADVAAIPAVAEEGAGGVGARAEEDRDIVGLVLHALLVLGPAGGEDIVADAVAVEMKLIEAEGGGVEAGRGDFPADVEDRAEIRAGRAGLRAAGEGGPDP